MKIMDDFVFIFNKKSPNFNKVRIKIKTYNFGICKLEFKTLLFIRKKRHKR